MEASVTPQLLYSEFLQNQHHMDDITGLMPTRAVAGPMWTITETAFIDNTRTMTPPSLLGMDHRIAYTNRKYHSGLICGGVFRGLVGV
jgi:hypothetical protein